MVHILKDVGNHLVEPKENLINLELMKLHIVGWIHRKM
jgi:hypothetical protein